MWGRRGRWLLRPLLTYGVLLTRGEGRRWVCEAPVHAAYGMRGFGQPADRPLSGRAGQFTRCAAGGGRGLRGGSEREGPTLDGAPAMPEAGPAAEQGRGQGCND